MKLLTNEQQESYKTAKICYIYQEKIGNKYAKDTKCCNQCHYTGEYIGVGHGIYNLKCNIPKEIPVVFHNGSNYDHHFIKKKLAEEFKGQFSCLLENTEKYITFSIEKEVKIIDKNWE